MGAFIAVTFSKFAKCGEISALPFEYGSIFGVFAMFVLTSRRVTLVKV